MLARVLQPGLQGAPSPFHQHLGPAFGGFGLTVGQLGQQGLLLAKHRPGATVSQLLLGGLLAASAVPWCWCSGHRLHPSLLHPAAEHQACQGPHRSGMPVSSSKPAPGPQEGHRAGDAGAPSWPLNSALA